MVQLQPAPASEKSVNFVDAIPWTLAGIGILASLGWNWFNYTRTTAIQQNLRQQQIKLEEFRRLRERIDEALLALVLRAKELKAAAGTLRSIRELRAATQDPERAISEAYVELQDQLTATDRSAYATGTNWLATAEPFWEAYAERIFAFREKRTAAEALAELDAAVGELANIRHALNQRLDQEIDTYANHREQLKRGFRPSR